MEKEKTVRILTDLLRDLPVAIKEAYLLAWTGRDWEKYEKAKKQETESRKKGEFPETRFDIIERCFFEQGPYERLKVKYKGQIENKPKKEQKKEFSRFLHVIEGILENENILRRFQESILKKLEKASSSDKLPGINFEKHPKENFETLIEGTLKYLKDSFSKLVTPKTSKNSFQINSLFRIAYILKAAAV